MEKVFRGDVAERESTEAPKPIIIKAVSGFPKPKDLTHKKLQPAATSSRSNTPRSNQITNIPNQEESNGQDFESENLKRVLSMSQAERDEAIREIQSMLSPSAVSNLLRIAEKKNKPYMDAMSSEIEKLSLSQNDSKRSADADVAEAEMPKTEAELEAALQRSSMKQRAALEWTGKVGSNQLSSSESKSVVAKSDYDASVPETSSSDPLSVPYRMKYDRFDLTGRKIEDLSLITSQIESILTSAPLMASYSESQRHDIAARCVDLVLRSGCLAAPPEHDSQPQHELHNHQFDQNKPGYTFQEISELFRSEVPTQHSMAARMLSGILQHRDMIVSLESYYAGAPLEDADLARNISVDESRSTESCVGAYAWPALQAGFNKLVLSSVDMLESNETSSNIRSSEAQSAATRSRLEKVARLLVFALTMSCAADLPMELPTLVVWGLSRKLPTKARSQLFLCLSQLARSAHEAQAGDALWCGFWGALGSPVWPTPHGRRAEVSYEEHIRNCLENAAEDDGDGPEDAPVQQRPLTQELALRCRWSRVDGLCEVPKLLSQCADAVMDGLAYLRSIRPSTMSEVSPGTKTHQKTEKNFISTMSAEGSVLVASARHSLEFLCTVAACAQNAETSNEVRRIAKKLFPLAQVVCNLSDLQEFKQNQSEAGSDVAVDPSIGRDLTGINTGTSTNGAHGNSVITHDSAVYEIVSLWWKLLAILSRGSFEFSTWLWSQDDLGSGISTSILQRLTQTKSLTTLDPSLPPFVWSLRLWRVFISYGHIASLEKLETFYYALRVSCCVPGKDGEQTIEPTDHAGPLGFKRLVGNALMEAGCPVGIYSGSMLIELVQLFECASTAVSGILQVVLASWMAEKVRSQREGTAPEASAWLLNTNTAIDPALIQLKLDEPKSVAALIDVAVSICAHMVPIIGRLVSVLDKAPFGDQPGTAQARLLLANAIQLCSTFIDPYSSTTDGLGQSTIETKRPFHTPDVSPPTKARPSAPANLPVRGPGVLWQLQALQLALHDASVSGKDSIQQSADENDVAKMVQSRLLSVSRLVSGLISLTAPSPSILADLVSRLAQVTIPQQLLLSSLSHDQSPRSWVEAELSFAFRRLVWVTLESTSRLPSSQNSEFAAILNYFKTTLKASMQGSGKLLVIPKASVATGLFSWQIARLTEADNICRFNIQSCLFNSDVDSIKIVFTCAELFSSLKHFPSVSRTLLDFLLSDLFVARDELAESVLWRTADVSDDWSELRERVFKFLGVATSKPSESFTSSIDVGGKGSSTLIPASDAGVDSCFRHAANGSLLTWVNEPFIRRPDLTDCSWVFRVFLELEYPHFPLWLRLIAGRLDDEASLGAIAVRGNPSLALYSLLLVTTPEHAYRWTEQPTDSFDFSSTWMYTEVDESTATSYLQLMLHSLRELLADDNGSQKIHSRHPPDASTIHTEPPTQFRKIDRFVETVFKESPPTNLRRAERQKRLAASSGADNTSESIGAAQSARLEVALLELSDRVLDSGVNQFLPASVHAAAMGALVHSRMPWRVQERVWRGLTENCLAHLIDLDSTVVEEMPAVESQLDNSVHPAQDLPPVATTGGALSKNRAVPVNSATAVRALSSLLYPQDTVPLSNPTESSHLHSNVRRAIRAALASLRRSEDAELGVFRCMKNRLGQPNSL